MRPLIGRMNSSPTNSWKRMIASLFSWIIRRVLTRMKAILGNCVQLHSATARVTQPGEPDQNWHRDGPWPMDPGNTPYGSIPGQINCGYFLDELTIENGPIAIVPGSQRVPFRPPEGHPHFPRRKICARHNRVRRSCLTDGFIIVVSLTTLTSGGGFA